MGHHQRQWEKGIEIPGDIHRTLLRCLNPRSYTEEANPLMIENARDWAMRNREEMPRWQNKLIFMILGRDRHESIVRKIVPLMGRRPENVK